MKNSYVQQNKALLFASLISLAVHMSIILILNKALTGKSTIATKTTIKIELVEIQTKQQPLLTVLKSNDQRSINTKISKTIRELRPLFNQQATSLKPRGELTEKKKSAEPDQSVDTASQISIDFAASASSRINHSGGENVRETTSRALSKERISIIQKEKPRCRPQCRKPRIPTRAEKRGEEGYAIFRLYVGKSGQVFKTELLESSGHSGWNNSARKTAMSQHFYPMVQHNAIEIMYEMKTKER